MGILQEELEELYDSVDNLFSYSGPVETPYDTPVFDNDEDLFDYLENSARLKN